MRNDENTLKKRMQESLKGKKVLTFGVTMTIGEYAIVPALSRFVKTHPDMDFHIRYGNTQTLLTYLHEGTIDFAIVEGYFSGDHYETRVYKTEEYIAVSSAHHTFSKPVHGGGCSGLYGDQQKLSLSCISSISEAVPKRISDGISNPSGVPSSQGDRAFRCIHCVFGRI